MTAGFFFDQPSSAPATQPVMKTLAETMTVSLLLNPDSKVWLVHDRPFTDIALWADYDIDSASLSLIMRNGKIQPLGLAIHPPVRKYLRQARQLYTMLLKDEKITDAYVLPLMVRETGYYRA